MFSSEWFFFFQNEILTIIKCIPCMHVSAAFPALTTLNTQSLLNLRAFPTPDLTSSSFIAALAIATAYAPIDLSAQIPDLSLEICNCD